MDGVNVDYDSINNGNKDELSTTYCEYCSDRLPCMKNGTLLFRHNCDLKRSAELHKRLDLMEGKLDLILNLMEGKLDLMEGKLELIQQKLEPIEKIMKDDVKDFIENQISSMKRKLYE